MLRRSFLSLLNLVPLGMASRFLPDSLLGERLPKASAKMARHRGWDIAWTELNSPTSLGAWMGVPTSKQALERKNHSALRTLVPRGDGRNPEHRKLVGLRRLDYMIASDWKPEFWRPGLPPDDCFRLGHTHVMESPFSKPRVPKDNIDIATDWQSLVRRSNV